MSTITHPKEIDMGRVIAAIKVENLEDLFAAKRGLIRANQVRSLQVNDALVDTGATSLSLPARMIQDLGLEFKYSRKSITPVGARKAKVYSPVRLSLMDRECVVDVVEVTNRTTALVGQIPLELMDFIVDPRHGKLIPNPAHGGEWTIELLRQCALESHSRYSYRSWAVQSGLARPSRTGRFTSAIAPACSWTIASSPSNPG